MSTTPESELNLEELFLPAWAKDSSTANKYAKHTGEDRPARDERRGGPRGPRREFGGARPGERRPGPQNRGDKRPGQPRGERPQRGGEQRFRREEPQERRAPEPLPEINLTLLPDEKGVESLARQIKMTGRAYPLFEIAKLVLQKPERQQVKFEVVQKDGKIVQPLFLCALDDSLWLSEDEAVSHVLDKHFATFYQAERTPTDPPKGVYTFVAQCGMSGTILGPPNYHDYQNQLRKLHAERFSRMPFETFKSRVKIVKDEAIVKKWIEDQSFKTEFICLNVPDAPRLQSREAVEKHFRETHLPNIIKQVESHTLSGPASRQLRCAPLQRLLRNAWEEQRRFPIKLATVLSQQFAQHGLQFFKVNKTITHVSVARPHYLDLETTPVSEGVKKIVEFINANPKCSRRKLIESLAPSPQTENAEPTSEQNAIIGDLHWLIHQGHVIEFADGILETAKKPAPRPAKPEAKAAAETEQLPGAKEDAVPNASVEKIEPEIAELEARPVEPAENPIAESAAASTPETPQNTVSPETVPGVPSDDVSAEK